MTFFEERYRRIAPDFTTEILVRDALRVNQLRIDPCAAEKRLESKKVLLEKIPYLRWGFWYSAEFSLGATPEYLFGYYYLQQPTSQLVSELLDPQPGEYVLDMAAAPGGKTTHLAQLMDGKGMVYALDNDTRRLLAVRNNCERLMIPNVVMLKKDARFVTDLRMKFDRVLLDAPCSGNFCSEPGWFEKRQIADVKANARMQRELLKAAVSVLKPGGMLSYSTCSLEPEEDELVIDWILRKFPELQLEEIDIPIGDQGITIWERKELNPQLQKTRRFWPHRTKTEGFFIALLRKA